MNWNRWNWPSKTIPFEEEEKAREWETLSQGERDHRIAAQRAKSLVYGWCQACSFKIETLGADWPSSCPRCGHG